MGILTARRHGWYNNFCRAGRIRAGSNGCMVTVVKWLTRRIVAPLRVGSIPTSHPKLALIGASPSGKALDSDSSIGGSNPSAPAISFVFPNTLPLGRRQVGKARDFDSRMRWFESSRPSHMTH